MADVNVNDQPILNESTIVDVVDSGVRVRVGGTWRTKVIDHASFQVENILTSQVDRCKFTVRHYGSIGFSPSVGEEVGVYNDGDKIFGGIIVKVTQRSEAYKVILHDVECEDYTRLLDRKLVADTFKDKTLGHIFSVLLNNYMPNDFTINNVKGQTKTVSYIAFNYVTVSEAIRQLAEQINYDWYVDYDKDVHFFSKETKSAPFDIKDDDGSYVFESLRLRHDNSQLRNVIYVRGGEYLADTFTTDFISDGTQNVWNLPYKYDELQVAVTGEVWERGIDGQDPISQYDYLWNKEEKFIRFRGDRIPNNGSTIAISGPPFLPVRVKLRDDDSIEETASVEGGDGQYEHLIIDKSIDSRSGARERAHADLEAYKETLSEGSFRTYSDGLRAGQQLTINSSAYNVNQTYKINRVVARMWTDKDLQYDISVVSTKTFGVIEFLQQLLNKETNQIVINENEIVDLVHSKTESATIEETSIGISTEHNLITETTTVSESVTEQDLNYLTEFVLGPSGAPTNTKRVFILNGSYLGPMGNVTIHNDVSVNESATVSLS